MSMEMWTIVSNDEPGATVARTKSSAYDRDENISLKTVEYSDEISSVILSEANEWIIKAVNSVGSDYGYDRSSERTYISYIDIREGSILVSNNHFAGIVMRSTGSTFNKISEVYDDLRVGLVRLYDNDIGAYCAQCGDSFSSDDHESWDITYYYLIKRSDIRK